MRQDTSEKELMSTCLYTLFQGTLRKEGRGPDEPEKFFHEFQSAPIRYGTIREFRNSLI